MSVEALKDKLSPCVLCPRKCRTKRTEGVAGYCKIAEGPVVSSAFAHFGEEPILVGFGGSGTIFFTGCNLGCIFCQNYDISHLVNGEKINTDELAGIMLFLEERGCHNINLVTPTHQTPYIAEAIIKARQKGLKIPVVYNCGGYESVDVLKDLNGLIDIYMPDIKTFSKKFAARYLAAPDYPEVVKEAVLEMFKQVGPMILDENGLAQKGLMIRHLVMPGWTQDSKEILRWISKNFGSSVYVNIMDQYSPYYRAMLYPEINRRLAKEEFEEVYRFGESLGLWLA